MGNFTALPTDTPLLDNLTLATLKWTSETTELGAGKGGGVKRGTKQQLLDSFGKYRKRWAGSLTGPVVADGVIYVSSFRPAGPFREFTGIRMRKKTIAFDEPIQLQLHAEDTLTAIDVETGKTLWTFATEGGFCWTHGKRGGLQIAPAVDAERGKAWFVGTLGTIYCVDITTGKELWRGDIGPVAQRMQNALNYYFNGEHMEFADKREQRKFKGMKMLRDGLYSEPATPSWHGGIRIIDGVVVVSDGSIGLSGFNPDTGEKLWHRGNVISFYATAASVGKSR